MPGNTDKERIGFLEATAIGIGGMVGGGIFAVLGLSVELTRGAAPFAFLLAGLVALVTAYSYSRLSIAFPSQGGTVAFLDRAFGAGLFTGSLNVLLWLSYIVMLALYSYAFGSYGASLFPAEHHDLWQHILISASIILISALNLFSAKIIGDAEDWIVMIKLIILLLFIVMGVSGIDSSRLAMAQWPGGLHIVAGGMLIFLAYEGFELIANSARDVRSPGTTLPRAFYSAVIFVIVLYVLIAAVTVGSLPVARILGAKDYALAEAARPFLGQTGFVLIAVAAMLSTASAINATLYGTARLSYCIARDGELPKALERKMWNEPVEGLIITAVLSLALANLANLDSISTMGSAGFLLIFAAVNAANIKLARKTGSRPLLSALGVALCFGALISLIWQTARTSTTVLWVLPIMAGSAFAIEVVYRLASGRRIHLSNHSPD
jgi:amino acid transporter